MRRSLKADLGKMQGYAFRRIQKCSELVRRFHALKKKINRRSDADLIWNLYDWLTAPLTLWPIDFEGLANHVLSLVKSDHSSDEQLILLLGLVGLPPGETAQKVIERFEHDIAKGRYEELVLRQEKYAELENRLTSDSELKSAWQCIRKYFRIQKFQNERGVIRRRMSQERNFRDGWDFDWRSPKKRFMAIFDALCYRWDLYGFQGDQPLLLKVSVNPTPHGTMIVVPRYWSFDKRRDLNWKEIGKLHGAHGATRQGPKMSMARVQRRSEALLARKLWDEASRNGLRRRSRYDAVIKGLKKDPRTDRSTIKRLLQIARGRAA